MKNSVAFIRETKDVFLSEMYQNIISKRCLDICCIDYEIGSQIFITLQVGKKEHKSKSVVSQMDDFNPVGTRLTPATCALNMKH